MGQGRVDDGGQRRRRGQGLLGNVVVVDLGDIHRCSLEDWRVATDEAHPTTVAPAVSGPPHRREGDGVSEGIRCGRQPVGMALLKPGDELEGMVAKGSHRARPCSVGRGLGT